VDPAKDRLSDCNQQQHYQEEKSMQSITFAAPSLGTAAMGRQDQIDAMVNQSTAAIVCSYLEHMNTAINKELSTNVRGTAFITESELSSLINTVQTALRTVA
jgi:hypothetical protein